MNSRKGDYKYEEIIFGFTTWPFIIRDMYVLLYYKMLNTVKTSRLNFLSYSSQL